VVRTGRIAYNEDEDWLIASDANGLYRVNSASTTASVTTITGISTACIVAIDSTGRAYAHVRTPNIIELLRFDDFATATSSADGTDIANAQYAARCGDLATEMTIGMIGGTEYGITVYQGSGATAWTV
jgi:hypothetical protein